MGSLVYMPGKLILAVAGTAVGIVIFPITDSLMADKTAANLIRGSIGGDYTISAAMLRGEDTLCYYYTARCN